MGCAHGNSSAGALGTFGWDESTRFFERQLSESLPGTVLANVAKKQATDIDAVKVPLKDQRLSVDCCKQDIDQVHANQTIIFIDWDDTLFPTTWARKHLGYRSQDPSAKFLDGTPEERLKAVSVRIVNLLSEARALGTVVILTNASRSWAAACRRKLMPEAQSMLQEFSFLYALELLSPSETKSMSKGTLMTEAKARAMQATVHAFHKANCNAPGWLNMVSIGDSDCERDAAQAVGRKPLVTQGVMHGKPVSKRRFTKTVKMLDRPSSMQLQAQLFVLTKQLSKLVQVESHVDIDLAGKA